MKIIIETTKKPLDYVIKVEGTDIDPPTTTIKDAIQALLLVTNILVQNQTMPVPQQQPTMSEAEQLAARLKLLRNGDTPTPKRSG